MSEQELIQSAREGDEQAIRLLYERHSPQVYSVARRLTGDDATAEDCAQEVWMRALRGLPKYRGDAAFSTWLHRIAINSALGARRQVSLREQREAPLDDGFPSTYPEEKPLLRMRLERALASLPERMRQVLVLHDVEGFTHQEIGALMGVDAGTSKSQLFRARAKMRDQLRGHVRESRRRLAVG
jgi:RNA polymerase sigma-70 factor (ECF subfamily)